ncbi:MAG: hypothetical protein ACJARX_001415 [Psychroserpens sp.]
MGQVNEFRSKQLPKRKLQLLAIDDGSLDNNWAWRLKVKDKFR